MRADETKRQGDMLMLAVKMQQESQKLGMHLDYEVGQQIITFLENAIIMMRPQINAEEPAIPGWEKP